MLILEVIRKLVIITLTIPNLFIMVKTVPVKKFIASSAYFNDKLH